MSDIYGTITTKKTPQREKARPEQVKNSAGGYVFQISPEAQVRRFLILGTDKPTYYAKAKDLTKDNAAVVMAFAQDNGPRLVEIIKEISLAGRAPKQNPTILALAIAASMGNGQKEALAALPQVCRTSTHLFLFVKYVEQFRGWGRALKRAVGEWYTTKSADSLAYQAVKYRQREGWTHRDVLRLAKPKGVEGDVADVLGWITKDNLGERTPAIITAFEAAQRQDAAAAAVLVRDFGLPWEAVRDEHINDERVLRALIVDMGMTALIRQLSRFSRVFPAQDDVWNFIARRLRDPEQISKARIHPVNVLVAMRTYAVGRNEHGTTWTPSTKVIDALDDAFYLSFGNIEPAFKRTFIGLDVSGSMGSVVRPGLSARDVATAMAMSVVASEPDVHTYAFTGTGGWGGQNTLTNLSLSKRQRLDDVVRMTTGLPFGRTDCSLPMLGALQAGLKIDTFLILTDNETWAGLMHPFQALRKYRQETGIDAKLVVAAFTSTGFSIADPKDAGMLDVVGMDSSLPALVADFSAGR